MERCRVVDEGAANWELPLPGFPEGPGPADGDAPGPADGTCAGLDALPGLPAEPGGALEADLSALSLYLAEPPQHELVLPAAEDAQCRCGCPGTSPPACGCRGKAVGGEHGVTHGQRACPVCSEALQRHDHRSGQPPTHQAPAPLACPESDRDQRSLRRHRELRHGLGGSRRPRDGDTGEAPPPHGEQPAAGPAAPPPDAFLPWGVASGVVSPAEETSAGCWGGLVVAAGDGAEREQLCRRGAAPPDACTGTNAGNAPVAAPGGSIKVEADSGEPAPGRPQDGFQAAQHPWESLGRPGPAQPSLLQLVATPRRLLPPAGERPAAEPLRAVFQQLPRLAPQPEPRARLQEAPEDGARRGPAASWQCLDVPGGVAGPWRPPGGRKQPALAAASPSQVAMASFSSPGPAPPAEKRRLTIFNRIQGGNIYRLGAALEEGGRAAARPSGAVPADGSGCESVFLCKTCSQLFGAAEGLEGSVCHRGGEEGQQARSSLGVAGTARTPAAAAGSGPSEPAAPPLVIPVSVPVPAGSQPGPGGRFQSNLRSPVLLVDRLLRDLVQRSPYTPPPMLSPVREGSGLYFSAVCSASAPGGPRQPLNAVLDRMDRDFGLCLVTDSAKISIEPHINVGSRFQAEIPALRERPQPGGDEQAASLLWKPWGDIATNRETQDRVTALLNMACSSAMPGGGMNLELALHCLHEAQGSVLEALEVLLFGGAQKPESHPLANYRYAGADSWTPAERQQFRRALCVHGKDFYLIQKKVKPRAGGGPGTSPRRSLLPRAPPGQAVAEDAGGGTVEPRRGSNSFGKAGTSRALLRNNRRQWTAPQNNNNPRHRRRSRACFVWAVTSRGREQARIRGASSSQTSPRRALGFHGFLAPTAPFLSVRGRAGSLHPKPDFQIIPVFFPRIACLAKKAGRWVPRPAGERDTRGAAAGRRCLGCAEGAGCPPSSPPSAFCSVLSPELPGGRRDNRRGRQPPGEGRVAARGVLLRRLPHALLLFLSR
ncbi:zinc finger protein 541 isoform X2 [Anser cygnoides]|uniref:zinc finger protein 541 isoform X2 n=1 Tax=Anser cygnoides TaxID=8845 RepID=UPI0034D35BB2